MQIFATRAAGYFITRATEAKVNAIAIPVLHEQAAIASINLIWVSRAASAVKFANEHLPRLTQAAREIEQAYAARVRGRA